jgi:hypothetical protein
MTGSRPCPGCRAEGRCLRPSRCPAAPMTVASLQGMRFRLTRHGVTARGTVTLDTADEIDPWVEFTPDAVARLGRGGVIRYPGDSARLDFLRDARPLLTGDVARSGGGER